MYGAHFFGAHLNKTLPPFALCLQRFATLVDPLRAIGVEAINCTPKSALKCFRMASLDDVWPSGDFVPAALSEPDQQTIHVSGDLQ